MLIQTLKKAKLSQETKPASSKEALVCQPLTEAATSKAAQRVPTRNL